MMMMMKLDDVLLINVTTNLFQMILDLVMQLTNRFLLTQIEKEKMQIHCYYYYYYYYYN